MLGLRCAEPVRGADVRLADTHDVTSGALDLPWFARFTQRARILPAQLPGVSALEYAILVGVLAAVLVTAVTLFGTEIASAVTALGAKVPSLVGNVGS